MSNVVSIKNMYHEISRKLGIKLEPSKDGFDGIDTMIAKSPTGVTLGKIELRVWGNDIHTERHVSVACRSGLFLAIQVQVLVDAVVRRVNKGLHNENKS